MAIDERDSTIAVAGAGEGGVDEECVDLEPFFYDEAAAAAERRRLREEEVTRKAAALAQRWAAHETVIDRITERDPETGAVVYTRFYHKDFSQFDIDEVSPLPPMRFTSAKYSSTAEARHHIGNMVNLIAVRIIPSDDVPFPIAVYGSLIARDDLDRKCLPFFNRSRDDPQLITSKDEALILTGPHRGLVLQDGVYLEIDLKLKDDQIAAGGEEEQLSKGLLVLDGIRLETTLLLEQKLLTAVRGVALDRSKLCTVQVTYAFISNIVEATVCVEALQGHFYGKITACTSRMKDSILLHDSKLVAGDDVMAANGNGRFTSVRLFRRVMAICLYDTLIVTVVAQADASNYTRRTMQFTSAVNGGEEAQITCGVNRFLVKVNWSLMHPVMDKCR